MNMRKVNKLLAIAQHALISPARPNPIMVIWRWRFELIGIGVMTLAGMALWRAYPAAVAAAVYVASCVFVWFACWPDGRRMVASRAWCVITPHRVRSAFARAGIYSTRRRLPAVLCCSPRSFGELVTLWLPAGLCPEDLQDADRTIAAACFATRVRVVPHPKYAHIVTLEVIRR
jgi:hypothetical protein